MDELIVFFKGGGAHMYPLTALLVMGIAIIIERFYMIRFVYSADGAALMQKVQRLILDNNINDAIKLCNSNKNASIYQVFKAALVNADRPFDEIQDHVEVATLAAIPKLQHRMPYLFTIANVATLLGLLGTVMGLIETFSSLAAVEGSQKQEMLSGGISTAMNCTAMGLTVAIPCMFVYGYLFNQINTIVDQVEHYSARLLLLLRTGSEYFEKFSTDNLVTTEQTPKRPVKKAGRTAVPNAPAPAARTASVSHKKVQKPAPKPPKAAAKPATKMMPPPKPPVIQEQEQEEEQEEFEAPNPENQYMEEEVAYHETVEETQEEYIADAEAIDEEDIDAEEQVASHDGTDETQGDDEDQKSDDDAA